MLIVQPMGGGKMHIIRMIGTMLRGIHLIIHPLLALTEDQVGRFLEETDAYGSIEAHNLDKHGASNSKFLFDLIKRLRRV